LTDDFSPASSGYTSSQTAGLGSPAEPQ
jgi:hypothetical protein